MITIVSVPEMIRTASLKVSIVSSIALRSQPVINQQWGKHQFKNVFFLLSILVYVHPCLGNLKKAPGGKGFEIILS